MKELIPKILSWNWNFPLLYNDKGNDWYPKFQYCCNLIDLVCDYYCTDHFAIYAPNSENWITVYLAGLARGKAVIVIPVNMEISAVKEALVIMNPAGIVFTDIRLSSLDNLIDDIHTLVNIDNLNIVYNAIPAVKTPFAVEPSDIAKVLKDNSDIKFVKTLAYENLGDKINYSTKGKIIGPSIINDTVEFRLHKTANEIYEFVLNAKSALPLADKNVVIKTDFANSHMVSIMLPLACNAHITDDTSKPHVLLTDTKYINEIWKECLIELFSAPLSGFLYSHKVFTWLFKKRAQKALKRLLGANVEYLIIYNSEISYNVLEILRDTYKVYTTYGIPDEAPLIAVNDSHPNRREKYNRGLLLRGYDVFENEDTLRILTPKGYTINTFDYGYRLPNGCIKVFGKQRLTNTDNTKEKNLLLLENMLNEIPFISRALVIMWNGKIYILVKPFDKLCDLQNMSYKKLKQTLEMYRKQINKDLAGYMSISKITITTDNIWEEHFNGQLKYSYYCI